MTVTLPSYNPRHPYPEWRDEFGPRGYVISRTYGESGEVIVHAVFCVPFPVGCARQHGFTEHVAAPPERFRRTLLAQVEEFERHAARCAECGRARENAALHVALQ
ncbi:hypothetical protein FHX37_1041 [Haloactinospora alba]|uniref:Uncharacterized protein n=1 Tax=Haloactinospora alba TaxID=405555 RepID=A0A543NH68_9ACTN|nr:hypothetical protein FHX37_1041 [Haloactinospora alba]